MCFGSFDNLDILILARLSVFPKMGEGVKKCSQKSTVTKDLLNFFKNQITYLVYLVIIMWLFEYLEQEGHELVHLQINLDI